MAEDVRMRIAAVLACLVALLLVVGCHTVPAAPSPAPAPAGGELTVFAASSLTDVFEQLGARFAEQNPGSRATFNFGPSSGLRVQLEQGARADVFASADDVQLERARASGLVGEPVTFASNALVLIVPRDNPASIDGPQDLARPDLRLVGTAPEVPIGAYARQALAAMSKDPSFGGDFDKQVLQNVRSEEDNVRAVVSKVALGEADAAIVYASDVAPRLADRVRALPIPEQFNVVASYPVAVVAEARQPALAARWVDLLLSETGQAALARHGFQQVR